MSLLIPVRTSQTCHPERSRSFATRTIGEVEGPLRVPARLRERMHSACRLAFAILREIFDEAAYERFLARRQLVPSAAAYAAFCRDDEPRQTRRPRCC